MDTTLENAIKHLATQIDEAWNNGDAAKLAKMRAYTFLPQQG